MNKIIRKAKVVDNNSPFNNQVVDILIENGIIKNIGKNLENNQSFEEFEAENLHVSQGWFDSSVSFGEPGFEDRETIENGLEVASKSGFTAVAIQPNTFPVVDNQSQIHFIKSKSKTNSTAIFPIGALTKNSEGKDLAELFDMQNAGAIAFGDYGKSIDNTNLLKIALQYGQDFDGLVISFCQDNHLKNNGIANEGIVATSLGLKGNPNIAESIAVAKNLFLLEYTGGKLHIPTISTAESVALIRQAKAKGLAVSCSVAVHHLVLTDECLTDFDTRYKISPPLRTEKDRQALLEGVQDGTIDAITSDHNPIDIENKKLEFEMAKNGTIGLESAFGALNTVLPLDIVIEKLTNARTIFNIESNPIQIGQKANLTLFDPNPEWIFDAKNILSKSKNSAFLGQKMKGKVYGICVS